MGVRMIPIVAVVSEDTFHALNDLMSGMPPVPAGMRAVMERNGWTHDAMVAGSCIADALGVPNPNPQQEATVRPDSAAL
jgi:hypothetical protein